MRVQDVIGMKKRKSVKLQNIETGHSVKLGWAANRQVQEELLEKKLMQWLTTPHQGLARIERYPTTTQQMITSLHAKNR